MFSCPSLFLSQYIFFYLFANCCIKTRVGKPNGSQFFLIILTNSSLFFNQFIDNLLIYKYTKMIVKLYNFANIFDTDSIVLM